jgi:hypothetical protein
LGNTKRKLKLTDLRVYDVANNATTLSNPVDSGYIAIPAGSIYDDNVNLVSNDIVMSFFPRPKAYDIYNNSSIGTLFYTYVEGDSGSINYGDGVSASIGPLSAMRRISFSKPTSLSNDIQIVDVGFEPTEVSPFNVMTGPLFRVTAELDTSSESEFDSNICTGNKEYKIMVDYNGTFSKTIITYEMESYQDYTPSVGPLPA